MTNSFEDEMRQFKDEVLQRLTAIETVLKMNDKKVATATLWKTTIVSCTISALVALAIFMVTK
jgi:hypothetical protein